MASGSKYTAQHPGKGCAISTFAIFPVTARPVHNPASGLHSLITSQSPGSSRRRLSFIKILVPLPDACFSKKLLRQRQIMSFMFMSFFCFKDFVASDSRAIGNFFGQTIRGIIEILWVQLVYYLFQKFNHLLILSHSDIFSSFGSSTLPIS